MDFLETIFEDSTGKIEIREIGSGAKPLFFTRETIKDYKPPKDKNVYFGVFDRRGKKGRAENCISSKVLWADYDNLTEGLTADEKAEEVKARIREAGLPKASIIVFSGNGIHTYWILNKRTSRGITEANRSIAERTGADLKATDKARILRLPDTFNVKGPEPIKSEILESDDGLEYDISHFIDLDDTDIEEREINALEANSSLERLLHKGKPTRPCIAKMLQGVSEGERNFVLGRITKYLQFEGYTKAETRKIILEWNKQNKPSEQTEKLLYDFSFYWKNDYKLMGCYSKNPELQQILKKYCSKESCSFNSVIGGINLENSIVYNNLLIKELAYITGNDLLIYGLLARHREGLTNSEIAEKLITRATGKPCISDKTRKASLDRLKKKGFIERTRGHKAKRQEDLYKYKPQGTYGKGYTLLSNGAINGAIDKRVTPGELRLYVLLMKYGFNKGICYPSLEELARELRTTVQNISNILRRLEKADYIKRNYKLHEGKEKLFISLLI